MKALGPYSPCITAGDFIFCSGQIGVDEAGSMKLGIKEQTRQVIENLKAVVNNAGSKLEQVVKCDVFLKNIEDYEAMNEIYAEYFNSPARVTVEVSGLPKDGLVEISCVAYKK